MKLLWVKQKVPPKWWILDTDGCWFCKNRNNCGGCKNLKTQKAQANKKLRKYYNLGE